MRIKPTHIKAVAHFSQRCLSTALAMLMLFAPGSMPCLTSTASAASSERIRLTQPMQVARHGHTATLLSDGRVLISGGYDAEGRPVHPDEIYDPTTETFAPVSPEQIAHLTPLPAPQPVEVPAGFSTGIGLANGLTLYLGLAGAGLYPDGEGMIALLENSEPLHRAGATLTELPADKRILVTGGVTPSNELAGVAALFNPAWIATDLDDYPPGATVFIDGGGFLPHEEVELRVKHVGYVDAEGVIHEQPDLDNNGEGHFHWITQADASGNLFDVTWTVCEDDCLYALLELTATGLTSGLRAQTRFTDGPADGDFTVFINPTTAVTGSAVTYSITITNLPTSQQNISCVQVAIPSGAGTPSSVTITATDPGPITRSWAVTSTGPSTMQFSRSGGSVNDIDPGGRIVIQFTATATTAGSKVWTTSVFRNNNCTQPFNPPPSQPTVIVCGAVAAAGAITGPSTVCSGATGVTYSIAPVSNATTYTWTVPTGATIVSGQGTTSIVVNWGSTSGNVTVTPSNACSTGPASSLAVTVNTPPSFTACPSNITANTDPDLCSAVVNYTATASGSPTPTLSYTFTGATTGSGSGTGSGSTFNKGVTTVTLTAHNACAPVATCSFTVTVNDIQPPVITLLGNNPMTVECHSAYTEPGATATDACDGSVGVTITGTVDVNTPGTYTLTYTATDATGNAATPLTRTVHVVDTTPPVLSCPAPITIGCSVEPLVSVSYSVTATDLCDSSPSVVMTPASGSGLAIGTTTVNVTATDASGNVASCSFTVTRQPLEFEGFLPPIGGADATGGSFLNPLRTFKLNSTIPVKFKAYCNGEPVLTGVHTLKAYKYSSETDPAPYVIDATPTDAATTGNQFRLTDGQWHFNLNTKAVGMGAGKWKLEVTLSDGSKHYVWIQLR